MTNKYVSLSKIVFLLAQTSYAATLFVATNGSDNNAGTQSAPFATIQHAVDLAKPGDTVSVANGTYGPNGHYTCGTQCSQSGYSAPVSLRNSGNASAPITIAAQNKWGAVLDCQLPYGYSGDGTDGIQACDAYFNFQGSASYITISGFDIQRAYWVGAMVNANNSHITFVGNHFHHIGNRIYNVPSGSTSFGIVGVFAGTGSSYITWDRNEFNNIGRLPHSSVVNDDYSHDHGLYIYNGPYTITNNIFYSQPAGWNIQTSPGSHDISIENNDLIGGANPQKDGCMMLWGSNSNVSIQNNVFYNGRNYAMDNYDSHQVGAYFEHNIVYGSPSGIISSNAGITMSANQMNANPMFVDAGANNYHLQSSSPAIGAGAALSVGADFDGAARSSGNDIGAYEFGGTATTAPPVTTPPVTTPPVTTPPVTTNPGLAAPTNVAAGQSSVSPRNQINVYWNASSGNLTGFAIFRSLDKVNFTQIATVGASATQYDNASLAPNTRYYYYVKAVNSAGMSAASNIDSAITKP